MIKSSNKKKTDCLAIGLIGRIGSGTSTLAKHLESEFKEAYRVRLSDMLISIAIEKGLPDDEESLHSIWASERDRHGSDDFLSRITFQHLDFMFDEINPRTIAVERIRMTCDIEEFKLFAKIRSLPLLLVYVHAEQRDRFNWFNKSLIDSGHSTQPMNRFHFNRIDNHECEKQIESLIGYCDVILENSHRVSLKNFLADSAKEILTVYGKKDFKY